jgi:branched-chain amino acid transport system substrate-binding protein
MIVAAFILAAPNTPAWHNRVNAAESAVLKLGLLLPPEEPQARSVREGVLLAQDQENKTIGRQVAVIIRGRTGQWGADGMEAARMVTDDGVDGLITPPDGAASHLTLQVSGRTAVPVVSLCTDASVGRTGVPWMLRAVPRTEDESEALFKGLTAMNPVKTNRWTAIVPDARAGREISQDLTRAAHNCEVSLRTTLELNPSLTNAGLIQKQALGSCPDAILLWLPPVPAGRMAKSLRGAAYTGVLAGPGWLQSKDFTAAAGDALEGFIIPQILRNNECANRWNSFRASYQGFWHREPDTAAAMSYDAASLLVYLLQRPEFQAPPHRVVPGFSWPGVTGDMTFDSEGNRTVKLELLRGHGGQFMGLNQSPAPH